MGLKALGTLYIVGFDLISGLEDMKKRKNTAKNR